MSIGSIFIAGRSMAQDTCFGLDSYTKYQTHLHPATTFPVWPNPLVPTRVHCIHPSRVSRPLFSVEKGLPEFAVKEAAAAYTCLLKNHPAIDNAGPMPSFDSWIIIYNLIGFG